MIKSFAAARASLNQPSVRPVVPEPGPDAPEDFRLCRVWGAPVNDSFCRDRCFCKAGDKAGRDYGDQVLTRAQCVAVNRPEVKK